MVKPSLNNQDILTIIGKRQMAAVAKMTLSNSLILREECTGQIGSLDVSETHSFESMKPVSTPAEQFDNVGIAAPAFGSKFRQSPDKFPNLLLGCLKGQIGRFPRVRFLFTDSSRHKARAFYPILCWAQWSFFSHCQAGHRVVRTLQLSGSFRPRLLGGNGVSQAPASLRYASTTRFPR